MTKDFFWKLAAGNMIKNGKTYVPYILSCIMTIAMYYIVKSLSLNPGMEKMPGGDSMSNFMLMGSWIVAVFACIFLFYTNSFLVKRRKKEFGIFHILGMEKRHLSKVLGWETVYVTVISLVSGLVLGIVLDKVMLLAVSKMAGAEVPMGFFISMRAVRATILLFAIIFLLIFINSVRQIRLANPIDLLHAANVGEGEPKANWLLAAFGVICLGVGYDIAITTEYSLESLRMFFIAVILVVAGTYMLFTAGTIVFLKALRKNKKFYYQARHFSSVSGMIYRMKQNAVGLANICILSTMVLVMVSSTASLMIGIEDIFRANYPADFAVYSEESTSERSEKALRDIRRLQKEKKIQVADELQYTYLVFPAIRNRDTFYVGRKSARKEAGSSNNLFFITLEDYNAVSGRHEVLGEGEVMVFSHREEFNYHVLKLFDREYTVARKLDDFVPNNMYGHVDGTQFIVVTDMEDIQELYGKQKEALKVPGKIRRFYAFNSNANKEEQNAFYKAMADMFQGHQYKGTVEARVDGREALLGLYGGFFFIGVFLGVLFVMATVLIIYYKQISEGYDDRERFAIMQKVGMSYDEVKRSIHSQVLMVFFFPLIVSGCHVAAAFPLISKLLEMLSLFNTRLYLCCTAASFLVFAVMYVLIYALTVRVYYRIVRGEGV